MRILRPEQRIYTIGNPGLRIENALASGAKDWWIVPGETCIAAYQPKGATSYAASKINLANPGTHDAIEGVAPTWNAATGWTFNGTTQWLDTGLNPGVEYTGQWSAFVLFSGATAVSYATIMGGSNSAMSCGIFIQPNTAGGIRYFNPNGADRAGGLASGVVGVAGSSTFNRRGGYRNGVKDADLMISPVALDGFYIGCLRRFGVGPVGRRACSIQALAIYSTSLLEAASATISAAMAAL